MMGEGLVVRYSTVGCCVAVLLAKYRNGHGRSGYPSESFDLPGIQLLKD